MMCGLLFQFNNCNAEDSNDNVKLYNRIVWSSVLNVFDKSRTILMDNWLLSNCVVIRSTISRAAYSAEWWGLKQYLLSGSSFVFVIYMSNWLFIILDQCLTNAFDSINRETIWKVLSRFGCPANFITILRLFHDKMTATVLFNGTKTEPFTIRTGVKQS